MKAIKSIVVSIIFLLVIVTILYCEPTFMNSYPYRDLFPPTVWAFNSYCCNVIPAIGGGFLLEVHMEPQWDLCSEPQAMFFKISDNGDLEWRKCLNDYNQFDEVTYFNSIVSNGIDRYYGVGRYQGGASYFYELDANCNVLTYKLLTTDSLGVGEINSIKLLDDGIIMAGDCCFAQRCLLMKTDFYGNMLWHKEYQFWDNGSTGGSEFQSIITTTDDCFIAIGYGNIFGQYSKGIIYKVDSVGDTLWTVKDDYGYKAILEYSSGNYYVLSAYYDFYLLHYDESGTLQETNLILGLGDGMQSSYSLINTNDNNLVLLYNTLNGEIHKITLEGTKLWSRDYIDNDADDSLIGIEEYKILETDNGDLVFCGTTKENYEDPELILIRTNPDGLEINEPPSQEDNNIVCYPNPIDMKIKEIKIVFFLKNSSPTELNIYNIKGQKVKHLINNKMKGGKHVIEWNVRDDDGHCLKGGIYLIKLKTENNVNFTKVILFK